MTAYRKQIAPEEFGRTPPRAGSVSTGAPALAVAQAACLRPARPGEGWGRGSRWVSLFVKLRILL